MKLSERQYLQVEAARQMEVYKRDDMIQNARYALSVQENRAILYLMSKIKPTDSVFQEYTFELKDFYAICGIESDSYTKLKEMLLELKKKVWMARLQDGSESAVSWIEVARVNKRSGRVTLGFHRDMMNYLLNLAEQGVFYTSYELGNVLPMQSRYSPRLYEILKSYQKNNREWYFEVEDLKRQLDCQNYKNFNDFKRWVLEPAVKEIRKYTDVNIAYDTVREGRKVVRVVFFMKAKSPEALLETKKVIREELDGQLSMDDILEGREDSVRAKFFREN